MKRFIQGSDRTQAILLAAQLDDDVAKEHSVPVIDVVVDELDLATLAFSDVEPAATGRHASHFACLLKIDGACAPRPHTRRSDFHASTFIRYSRAR
jgi:hypothetical protein